MSSNLVLTTIFAVVFVCLVKETDGLKCYECTLCNDPFDSNEAQTIDCNGACIKAKVSGHVARGCSLAVYEDTCASVEYGGQKVEGCLCNSDLCNGGSVNRLSVMLSVTIFVVMVLKAMIWYNVDTS